MTATCSGLLHFPLLYLAQERGSFITIENTSTSEWTSWSLAFTFPASGQSVTQSWNGVFTQSGQNVTVTDADRQPYWQCHLVLWPGQSLRRLRCATGQPGLAELCRAQRSEHAWNNRQISWQFIPAPNYTGDIQIGFLQGANPYWQAAS